MSVIIKPGNQSQTSLFKEREWQKEGKKRDGVVQIERVQVKEKKEQSAAIAIGITITSRWEQ